MMLTTVGRVSFLLSLPERVFRALAAALGGTLHETFHLALPRVVRESRFYEATAKNLLRVTIELVGPQPIVRPKGEDWGFVAALTSAVRAFVGTVNALIIVIGGLLPVIILGLIALLVVRSIIRRRRRNIPPAEEA